MKHRLLKTLILSILVAGCGKMPWVDGNSSDSLMGPDVLGMGTGTGNPGYGTGTGNPYNPPLPHELTPTPTPTPAKGPDGATNRGPFEWVTGYYKAESACDMPPSAIKLRAFTHLVHFASEPTDPTVEPAVDPEMNEATYSNLYTSEEKILRDGPGACREGVQKDLIDAAHAANVRVILSVGGEAGVNAERMQAVSANDEYRKLFVAATLRYAFARCYDGIEIHWEAVDPATVGELLSLYREGLDAWAGQARPETCGTFRAGLPGELLFGSSMLPAKEEIDPTLLEGTVNQFNLVGSGMEHFWNADAQDEYGSLNSPIGFPSVLANCGGAEKSGVRTYESFGPGKWMEAGFSAKKFGMLLPFEAKEIVDGGPCAPWKASNTVSYETVLEKIAAHPGDLKWDDGGDVPYLLFTDKEVRYFYTFDNEESIRTKVEWAAGQGITGIGIWDLGAGWLTEVPVGQAQDPLLEAFMAGIGF